MPSPTVDPTVDPSVDPAIEPLVVRGPSLREALAAAEAALGRPVRAVKADRIRRGGIAGFFATDLGVEVTAVPVETELVASDGGLLSPVDLDAPVPADNPFETLDFAAPPSSFEAALQRLVDNAGMGDGLGRQTVPPTPVRDPAPRADTFTEPVRPARTTFGRLSGSLAAPLSPIDANATLSLETLPAPTPAAVTETSVATDATRPTMSVPAAFFAAATGPTPTATPAAPVPLVDTTRVPPVDTTPVADPAEHVTPATAPTAEVLRPEVLPAPVAAATTDPHGETGRANAAMAALAAGDLLGRMLDHQGVGPVTVTVTITGADGTKCRAEAHAERK